MPTPLGGEVVSADRLIRPKFSSLKGEIAMKFFLYLLVAGFGWISVFTIPPTAIRAGHNSFFTSRVCANGISEISIQKSPNGGAA